MEPENSSPYSQTPATCPYHEPTRSSPHNPFQLPEDPSNIILPSASWSPELSPSLGFPHQNLVHTSPFLQTCHMPRPSHSIITYIKLMFLFAASSFKSTHMDSSRATFPQNRTLASTDLVVSRVTHIACSRLTRNVLFTSTSQGVVFWCSTFFYYLLLPSSGNVDIKER